MEPLQLLRKVKELEAKGDKSHFADDFDPRHEGWESPRQANYMQQHADAERQRIWAKLMSAGIEVCRNGVRQWVTYEDNKGAWGTFVDRDEALLAGMEYVLEQQRPVITMTGLYPRLKAALAPLGVNEAQCDTLGAILTDVQRAAERERT